MATLLHNPRCSKSRQAKALLEEAGVDFTVREYLKDPLGAAELADLHARLGRPVAEWTRFGEDEAKDAGVTKASSDAELLAAMAAHPKLMERPILIAGDGAVVGRPPENVVALATG